MVRIWRQIYAIKAKKAPSRCNRNHQADLTAEQSVNSNPFSMVVEEEGKQVKPKRSHEMPVDAEAFEPYDVAAVNGAIQYAYSIDYQVYKPECKVQDVHGDQCPKVPTT